MSGKNMSVPQYYYWKKKFKDSQVETTGQFIDVTTRVNKNSYLSEVEIKYSYGIRISFSKFPGNKTICYGR
ncbi:MAG: hypothetical protein HOP11_03595 [Saprospiraceae bacterium]|nr:hypothetical protein [Saprospiraceae bacterium]